MNFIAVALTFSTGLPIFYLFLSLGILFTFWLNKLIFVRYATRPDPYSSDLMNPIYVILKFGLIVKMCFSIFFLSNNDIFPKVLDFVITKDHTF